VSQLISKVNPITASRINGQSGNEPEWFMHESPPTISLPGMRSFKTTLMLTISIFALVMLFVQLLDQRWTAKCLLISYHKGM